MSSNAKNLHYLKYICNNEDIFEKETINYINQHTRIISHKVWLIITQNNACLHDSTWLYILRVVQVIFPYQINIWPNRRKMSLTSVKCM